MTTELQAAANAMEDGSTIDSYYNLLVRELDDTRRRCNRLQKENDEYRHLIVEMRKKVAEVMHSSMDDYK